TPSPVERPNRLPPDRATPKICSTILTGLSRSVSRVAGAAPRTSTPAVAPDSIRTTVQPVGRSVSVWCPTLMPGTAVSVAFAGVCAIAGLKPCATFIGKPCATFRGVTPSAPAIVAADTRVAQGFSPADRSATHASDSARRFMPLQYRIVRTALIDRVTTEVDRATAEMVQFTADLVRIPTVNPPGEEYDACAHFLGDFLQQRAFEVEYIAAEGRPEHTPRHPRVNVIGSRRGGPGPVVH